MTCMALRTKTTTYTNLGMTTANMQDLGKLHCNTVHIKQYVLYGTYCELLDKHK